jgi:hypothetical protein
VGGVGFAAFYALTSAQYARLYDLCGVTRCPNALQPDVDAGERYQTLTNVSLGVGIAAAVTGVVLVAIGARVAAVRHAVVVVPRQVRVAFTPWGGVLAGTF